MIVVEINSIKCVFKHCYTGSAQRKQRKRIRAFILENGGCESDFIKYGCEKKESKNA